MKILGDILELPAKQHCQFSAFTSKLDHIGQIGSAVLLVAPKRLPGFLVEVEGFNDITLYVDVWINASHTYRAGGISESPGEVMHSGNIVQYSGLEIGLTNLEKVSPIGSSGSG